ncbi:hypothetical protein BLNAU_11125 [Blattamonas nauphoetae]|uniref:Polymorphic outer membrane protein n=1 Tax=Blattamonas nauphoetae TaxID=2049346 RepID=A0ABQ9XRC9_9EUKA|nr:hypothetical protein BLNAU_11125 [Blattamonas nauphoetae]
MKVVGPDGMCVSQTNHRTTLSSFEGISTTVSEVRIMNMSSLPGEVKESSSLFSQRMIGCSIWGSNNHLSGSLLRDMNGGGSFLCSNSTFEWCHTTSSERPSLVSRPSPTIASHSFPTIYHISNQDESEGDSYTDQPYDGVDRLNITNIAVTFTRCTFTNMKYTATSSSLQLAGGSAIYFNYSFRTVSIISSSFSKCSVTSSWTVWGGSIFLFKAHTSPNTIDACSFDDWYPSTATNTNQHGGGLGFYQSTTQILITKSNFTLSGNAAHTNNGGFFAYHTQFSEYSLAITNCRFVGDTKTTGRVMYFDTYSTPGRIISIIDSQIIETNSKLQVNNVKFSSISGFTRTDFTNTSIEYSYASRNTHPFLFLDSAFEQCSIYSPSNSKIMFLFSGSSFTGEPAVTSKSIIELSYASHVVFHKCTFTDCSPAAYKSVISTPGLPSLVMDTCLFTRCSGGYSTVEVSSTHAFFYFCSFTNVSGTYARVMMLSSCLTNFFEGCRFDLEETTSLLDVYVTADYVTCLNETAVIGCTSNRKMYFGTKWAIQQVQNITLDNTPFIRLKRTEKDASLTFERTTPLLDAPLTAPFIVCEGAQTVSMQFLTLNSSFVSSASFISAKESTITHYSNKIQLLSTANGAFLHLEDGSIRFWQDDCQSCSGVQGGVLFSRESSVTFTQGTYSNCQAVDGGIACLISSTLNISQASFVSNSAKQGGVFWIDCGTIITSSDSSLRSNFTNNSAKDVSENGVDSGKGGAIFMKGTTASKAPLVLTNSRFENTAAFGNDVFIEESLLGEATPDLLSTCGGESNSNFPHLEIENHNEDDELLTISNFIPFPTVRITNGGSDVPTCKWTWQSCQTIDYMLQFLQTTYPNGSLFQRHCIQNGNSMTTEPVELEKHDLVYTGYYLLLTSLYSLSLTADYTAKEGVVFTIKDESRLTVERIKFPLSQLHQVVNVKSKDGRFAMDDCYVLSESDTTTSISPIFSVGSSLILNNVFFGSTLTTSIANLSAPLVHFATTPSGEDELGSGTFEITNTNLTNLTFEGTTMFNVETSGRVSFILQSIDLVSTDLDKGKYISLKGQSFKQQIQPELWHSNPTTSDMPYFIGEDISMDENDKWRNESLVYWLISPSEEILIGSDANAVDHPNCGSTTFQCTTLDSAFRSAGFNELSTLSLSIPTSLSFKLLATSEWLLKSSSATKQGIYFDGTGSVKVADSEANLSFASIIFTVAQTCESSTLILVEEGELSFSSCLIGSESSSSPHVLPASTTTLIEVKADGTLTLTDTFIQG